MAENQMQTPVISCRELRKGYRGGFMLNKREILKGVSFDVQRGEIFGFLGPNGAGKTTTIKLLLGLGLADGGSVEILGEPPSHSRVRRRLGFLPDKPYFYESLSGLQTMALAGRMLGLDGGEISRRSEALLERVGLDRTAWKQAVRGYSRGMMQRLGLAQALLGEPELLICDEPMGGLDPIAHYEVREILREQAARGCTVFFSTHILGDVHAVCDRVGVIAAGRIVRLGTLDELLEPEVRGYELTVNGVDAELIDRIRADAHVVNELSPRRYHLQISGEEKAQSLVREAISVGGKLETFSPIREDLDEFFYRIVAGSKEEQQ